MKASLCILFLFFCQHALAQITVSYPEPGLAPAARSAPDVLRPAKSLSAAGVVDTAALGKADALVQKAIDQAAFPGCRVLAAKDGKIFYDKSFGYLTYERTQAVSPATIYDLASLTKVVSTTLAIMKLSEQGRIDIEKSLGDYLSITRGTDKDTIKLRDLLLHQAGLKAWIPFYRALLDSGGKPIDSFFSNHCTGGYCIPVAKDLYLREDYRDSVWKIILNSPLENRGRYVYSDLDYYFLAAVVEQVAGEPLNLYVAEHFYRPMRLHHIGYMPLGFSLEADIAPTEDDMIFRRQILRGYVHDPGAAMFGGVAGHAGVFATAGDVAAVFQMLLAGGKWHGRRYFRPETVRYFTAYHSAISRRALGFDKPLAEAYDAGPTANRCSGYTFGHQGFTGTCAWADPGTGVVYVFLSNRVFPDAENKLINRLSTRTTVQDALYEALGIPDDTSRPALKRLQMGQ
jgi:CubicO group peptidase (beta-lactamase class C family)